MKRFSITIIFLFFSLLIAIAPASGQEDSSVVVESFEETEALEEEALDSSFLMPVRVDFDSAEIDTLRKLPEYAYMAILDSSLRNMKMKESPEKKEKSSSIFDSGLLRTFYWSAAILAVLYVLYQLLAGQQRLFYRNKKYVSEEIEPEKATVPQSPLLLAQQAAARGDYRQAVRYYYLYILQRMGEKRMIILSPEKTNNHYLRELGSKPVSSDFARVSLQYDFVWYGGFAINKAQYEKIESGYRKFIEAWL